MMQTEMSNILLGLNISETVYKTTKIKIFKGLVICYFNEAHNSTFFFLMEVTMNYCISVNSTEFMGQFFKLNGFLSCTNSHP